MGLDVEPPEPPELPAGRDADEYDDANVETDEYRREELQAFLEEGAWERAFNEWAEHTDVTEEEWAIVLDLGLIERFDFYKRTSSRLFQLIG